MRPMARGRICTEPTRTRGAGGATAQLLNCSTAQHPIASASHPTGGCDPRCDSRRDTSGSAVLKPMNPLDSPWSLVHTTTRHDDQLDLWQIHALRLSGHEEARERHGARRYSWTNADAGLLHSPPSSVLPKRPETRSSCRGALARWTRESISSRVRWHLSVTQWTRGGTDRIEKWIAHAKKLSHPVRQIRQASHSNRPNRPNRPNQFIQCPWVSKRCTTR